MGNQGLRQTACWTQQNCSPGQNPPCPDHALSRKPSAITSSYATERLAFSKTKQIQNKLLLGNTDVYFGVTFCRLGGLSQHTAFSIPGNEACILQPSCAPGQTGCDSEAFVPRSIVANNNNNLITPFFYCWAPSLGCSSQGFVFISKRENGTHNLFIVTLFISNIGLDSRGIAMIAHGSQRTEKPLVSPTRWFPT